MREISKHMKRGKYRRQSRREYFHVMCECVSGWVGGSWVWETGWDLRDNINVTMYQIEIRPPITKLFNKENNILEWANSWRSSSQINKKVFGTTAGVAWHLINFQAIISIKFWWYTWYYLLISHHWSWWVHAKTPICFIGTKKTKQVWEISLSLSGSQPPTSVGSNF